MGAEFTHVARRYGSKRGGGGPPSNRTQIRDDRSVARRLTAPRADRHRGKTGSKFSPIPAVSCADGLPSQGDTEEIRHWGDHEPD
jgi:hypothetical protein